VPPSSIEQYRQAFESNTLTREQFGALLDTVRDLGRQVEWLKRQMFGEKSERRLVDRDPTQGTLGQGFDAIPTDATAQKRTILVSVRAPHLPESVFDLLRSCR
jgi:hypothetical protein